MAGGIDWFRWHHGAVSDPKFQLVAKRAGSSVADVIAVWACLLEAASQTAQRGRAGQPDFEALDCALGLQEGRAQEIYTHMQERGLIGEDGAITAWDRRQPKREDDTAADRKRRQRERERDATGVTHSHAESRNDTQTARGVPPRHDRGEERRGEEIPPSSEGGKGRSRAPARPEDVSEQTWSDWLQLRKSKKAPVTETVIAGARAEAAKAGLPIEEFLRVWCTRGSQGLQADWLRPEERGARAHGSKPGQLPLRPTSHTGLSEKNYREGVNSDGSIA